MFVFEPCHVGPMFDSVLQLNCFRTLQVCTGIVPDLDPEELRPHKVVPGTLLAHRNSSSVILPALHCWVVYRRYDLRKRKKDPETDEKFQDDPAESDTSDNLEMISLLLAVYKTSYRDPLFDSNELEKWVDGRLAVGLQAGRPKGFDRYKNGFFWITPKNYSKNHKSSSISRKLSFHTGISPIRRLGSMPWTTPLQCLLFGLRLVWESLKHSLFAFWILQRQENIVPGVEARVTTPDF